MEIFSLRLPPLLTPIYTELIQCFQKVNINTIHGINLYLVDNSVAFTRTYLLNSDFSNGKRRTTRQQLGKHTKSKHTLPPLPLGFSKQQQS